MRSRPWPARAGPRQTNDRVTHAGPGQLRLASAGQNGIFFSFQASLGQSEPQAIFGCAPDQS